MTSRGEQYAGWKALPDGDSAARERGSELIRQHGGVKEALFATHPDHGGDAADFAAVQEARALSDTARPIIAWRCPGCGTGYTCEGDCGQNQPFECRETRVLGARRIHRDQREPQRIDHVFVENVDVELVRVLVDRAPVTDGDRGIGLLLELINEGKAKLVMT